LESSQKVIWRDFRFEIFFINKQSQRLVIYQSVFLL
jgi:hypothetical protein